MAVPKKKVSKSRRNMRRAHDFIKPINIVFDSETGEPKLPHHASLVDGKYKGMQVFETRQQKKLRKAKELESDDNNASKA